jgi:ABC-type multidrug transport system permease subunit
MSLNIKEMYSKYDKIIKYSTYAFAGWFLSWVLFFIMLPSMIGYFGKVKGAFLNYALSWISMILFIIILSIFLEGAKY